MSEFFTPRSPTSRGPDPCFTSSQEELRETAEELTPELFESLSEKYGDKPEWMKVTGYREGRDPVGHRRRGEVMLNLSGKDYWFPVSPKIYETFVTKIVTENRGAGLRYLQQYIRRYRTYKERWPSKRYVRVNRIYRDSFFPESVTPSQVGLSQPLIDAIIEATEAGWSAQAIADELRLSRNQVESVLACQGFSKRSITDELIRRLADGEVEAGEAVESLATTAGDQHKSKKALRVMDQGRESTKPIRLARQKPRSGTVRITPTSI
jgi:hypothetical protein